MSISIHKYLLALVLVLCVQASKIIDTLSEGQNIYERNKHLAPVILAVCAGLLVFCCCCALPRLLRLVAIGALVGASGYFAVKTFAPNRLPF